MRPIAVVLAALLPLSLGAQTWHFRTLAGSASGGGAVDGAAAQARFALPTSVVACAEAIFIADAGNHAIRRISRDGVVTTWAGALMQSGRGDGDRLTARFRYPTGIAADAQCNLFVADRGNHTIRKISAAGVVTTIAGSAGVSGNADGNASAARFNGPQDVAIDTDGTLWISDTGNNRVRRIGPDNRVTTISRTFNTLLGIAVDASGNAYAADYGNHQLIRITRDGNATIFFSLSTFFPSDVAFDPDGGMWVLNYADNSLQRIGNATLTPVTGSRAFDQPRGIAFDAASDTFVIAEQGGCTIRRATRNGEVATIAGTSAAASEHLDAIGTAARFVAPSDLDVDANGVVYVTDSTTIRRIARDGAVTTMAGTPGESLLRDGSRSDARFRGAGSIAVEPSGTLIVSDDNTLRRVTMNGEVTTICGSQTAGYVDGPCASARFNFIASIAVAPDGTIYVADAFNKAIRKIADGVATTLATSTEFGPPMGGLDLDAQGNLYLWVENFPSVFRVTRDGGISKIATDDSLATLLNGLAVAPDGTIYLGGFRTHAIYRVLPGSSKIEVWAGDEIAIANVNGTPDATRFRTPSRLDVAPDGKLYVRDLNRSIRVASVDEPEATGPRRRAVGK